MLMTMEMSSTELTSIMRPRVENPRNMKILGKIVFFDLVLLVEHEDDEGKAVGKERLENL
ncbi:MAG: hypothetical protein MZU95_11130 [Desulfomicrobium escambiense]|nr:hypothetical protein [Desulfomicrobium escambiense]